MGLGSPCQGIFLMILGFVEFSPLKWVREPLSFEVLDHCRIWDTQQHNFAHLDANSITQPNQTFTQTGIHDALWVQLLNWRLQLFWKQCTLESTKFPSVHSICEAPQVHCFVLCGHLVFWPVCFHQLVLMVGCCCEEPNLHSSGFVPLCWSQGTFCSPCQHLYH